MSFTFRSAEENFIAALPSKVADIYYSDYFNGIQEELTFLNKVFPFALSAAGKEYVAERGIRVSPFGSQTHPHPISKIFENHMIYNVLPRFIQPNSHLAVFSMKQSKSEYLYFRARDFDLDLINRFLCAQDYGRYTNKTIIQGGSEHFEKFVHNLVPRFRVKTPDLLFFHDELMHWSLDDFIFFLIRINPSQLAFTFVFPVELLVGINQSCNSVAYNFETLDGDLFFYPDGSKQHPYQHSGSNDWPFRVNEFKIKVNDVLLSFTLDLVESHGAHHFFILKRGAPVKQSKRFFKDFDCTFLNDIHIDSRHSNLSGVVRTKILAKVFNYLTCLKKKDVESALAKLRQLTEGKLMDHELLIIHDLSDLLSKYSLCVDEPSFLDWINPFKLRENLKLNSKFLDFIFGSNSSDIKRRLRAFSSQIKPLSIVVECKAIEATFNTRELGDDGKFSIVKTFSRLLLEKQKLFRLDVKGGNRIYRDPFAPVHGSVIRMPAGLGDIGLKSCKFLGVTNNEESNEQLSQPKPLIISEVFKETEKEIISAPLLGLSSDFNLSEPNQDCSSKYASKKREDINELVEQWKGQKKNGCFLTAVCSTILVDPFCVQEDIFSADEEGDAIESVRRKLREDLPLLVIDMEKICKIKSWRVWIYLADEIIKINDLEELRPISIGGREGHVFKLDNLNFFNCVSLLEKAYFNVFKTSPDVSKYEPDLHRASRLLESFTSMLIGLVIDKKKILDGRVVKPKILKQIRDGSLITKDRSVNVVPFCGFAGSGKTKALFDLVGNSFSKVPFLWISPRSKVLDGLMAQLDIKYKNSINVPFKRQFVTFEKALLIEELPELIIIDESPLLPPGYIDLLLCKKNVSCKTSIALIGDPLQCKFFCQDNLLMHNNKVDFLQIISQRMEEGLKTHYLMQSYRFGHHKILDFVPTRGEDLVIKRLKQPSDEVEAILVASEKDKRAAGGETNSKVMTIGESQGCTFNHCALVLSEDLNLSDIGTVITGLTRAKSILEIVSCPVKIDFFLSFKRGANNCAMIANMNSVHISNLCKPLLNGLELVKFTEAGADFELKLEGDPFLKSMLSMVSDPSLNLTDENLEKIEVQEPFPKTHLPLVEPRPLEIECFEKIRAREFREFWVHGSGWSSQFEDNLLPKDDGAAFLGPAFNPQNIFPRHKADDQITFWAAVKKRLFFSDPTTQMQKYRNARHHGKEILRVFLKKVPINPEVNEYNMECAISEFEEKKISKSADLIKNHSIRSDTDWDERNIFLFMKSQLCKKKEKMFCDAKAGQTLACFSHVVLVKFSGICRYIEKKVSEALPENYYIHQKKDFREFENWVKINKFDNYCTESDYEAFDASQDHVALAFEVALMEYLKFSNEVIEDYVFIKTHLYCKLGEFAIMRFTGEFCTFLFNTLVNMAFTFLKYDVKSNTAICFAGDDMCANARLGDSKEHKEILALMSLKAKVDFTRTPTFCGWYLSKHGIVKCPFLMCARLSHAMYKNELKAVINSYFLEFCFAYEKKDLLLDFLSERDLDFHYTLTRFFVKNASMLEGSAREAIIKTREHGRLMFGEGFGNDHFKSDPKRNLIKQYIDNYSNYNRAGECQSLMSKNSSVLQVGQNRSYSLMELTNQKFTQILGHSNQNQQMLSRDSKLTLQYQYYQSRESCVLTPHLLTRLRQIVSKSSAQNTAYCIFQQYCCQSRDYSPQASKSKEECSYMMQGAQRCVQLLKMGLNSTLLCQIGHTICTAQIIWFRYLTLGCTKVLNCALSSLGCIWRLGLMHSMWTLASCTDCSTIPMKVWLGVLSEKTGFKSFRHVIDYQILTRVYQSMNSKVRASVSYSMLVTKMLVQRPHLFLGQIKGELIGCAVTQLGRIRASLGWAKLKLKIILTSLSGQTLVEFLKKLHLAYLLAQLNPGSETTMSARNILNETIRMELREYLWTNIVDPGNAMALTPAQGVQLTEAQTARKNLILDHFLRNLFGNIGVEGASDKVSFLNMELALPAIPAAQLGAQDPLVIRHNLAESVGAIKAWRDNHPSQTIRGLTFRACCKPFANHCMDFLLANPDVRTNLYFTQPHNYGKAPEVAFDFADGITPNRLANNKDRQFVMSALASRTFNHESKKGVFEAQGSVNFTFDG